MKRFATGLLAGSVIAVVGAAYMMSDKKLSNQMHKHSHRAVDKASEWMEDVLY